MKNITLFTIIAIILACQPKTSLPRLEDPLLEYTDPSLKPFYYGVASGDPLHNAVIIWTKVSPEDSIPNLKVNWEMSVDEQFDELVAQGDFKAEATSGYTVKVDVQGLEAGTRYFYRFKYNDTYSPVGRTMTATKSTDSLKLVIISCSNYEFGPFNTYGALAERRDINAILHLGDYIYEYGPNVYGDSTTNRFHLPPHEIVSLSDYRTRYAQYRLDKDLREAHQMHPFITIWDDHEIANDAYKTGAQNHQEDKEGAYSIRSQYAKKAYYEWLPVRSGEAHYRSFSFGEMADIIMLDERLAGRTAPVDSVSDPNISNHERAMLGEEQLAWFQDKLSNSRAKWKVIGNQVIFSYLDWGFPNFKINLDSWDGYPRERADIIKNIKENDIRNVLFTTGDTHTSWALEVTDDPFGDYKSNGAIAIEYGTTSINSGNTNDRPGVTDEMAREHEANIVSESINPHLRFTNMRDHGYLELTLFADQARARWYYTPSRVKASRDMYLGMEKITPTDSNQILDSILEP